MHAINKRAFTCYFLIALCNTLNSCPFPVLAQDFIKVKVDARVMLADLKGSRSAYKLSPELELAALSRSRFIGLTREGEIVLELSAEGCDRASAKDFHEIRAVFTRGVA
jgi:hypothetical protein